MHFRTLPSQRIEKCDFDSKLQFHIPINSNVYKALFLTQNRYFRSDFPQIRSREIAKLSSRFYLSQLSNFDCVYLAAVKHVFRTQN